MTSLYDNSIDLMIRALKITSSILKKGEQYAEANNISQTDLITSRIYEDMLPLTNQINYIASMARAVISKLTGASLPESEGEKKTLQELYAIIDDARQELEAVGKASVDGKEQQEIEFNIGPRMLKKATISEYTRLMIIPNLYFHLVIAYAILRQKGVPLGKLDYLNEFINTFEDA